MTKSKVIIFIKTYKMLVALVGLLIVSIPVGVIVDTHSRNKAIQLAAVQAQEEAEQQARQAQLDVLDRQEAELAELGIGQDDLDEVTPSSSVPGTCKNGGDTIVSGDSISINILRNNTWTCVTYKMSDLKDFKDEDGSVVNGSVSKSDSGHNVTNVQVKDADGTNHVNTGYTTDEGGMSWGGTGFEKCFGANNTACIMVDDLGEFGDGGASFISMVQSCFLVSAGGEYWRVGTSAELKGRVNPNTSSFSGSCASFQSYKNLFYNK